MAASLTCIQPQLISLINWDEIKFYQTSPDMNVWLIKVNLGRGHIQTFFVDKLFVGSQKCFLMCSVCKQILWNMFEYVCTIFSRQTCLSCPRKLFVGIRNSWFDKLVCHSAGCRGGRTYYLFAVFHVCSEKLDFPQTFFSCQKTVYKQKSLYMCPQPYRTCKKRLVRDSNSWLEGQFILALNTNRRCHAAHDCYWLV